MKKAFFIVLLCAVLLLAASPLPVGENLAAKPTPTPKSNEKCFGWWAFQVCIKPDFSKTAIRMGIKVSYLPYYYVDVLKDGCFNANPTKLLANMKYCVKDFVKPVKTNNYTTSFKFQVEGCVGVWRFKSCKSSSWFNFKYP
jgi:hypothetical protein